MHCPLLQTFWLHPFVILLIQFTTVDTRPTGVASDGSGFELHINERSESRPINFTSLVSGSIQAAGPKERQQDNYNNSAKIQRKVSRSGLLNSGIDPAQWIQGFFNYSASTALAIGAKLLLKYPSTTSEKAKS